MAERHTDVPAADAQDQERHWVPKEHLDENPRLDMDGPGSEASDRARSVEQDEEEDAH